MIFKNATIGLLLVLSLTLIPVSGAEAYDIPGKLYRVSIESYLDAKTVRNSGVDVVLGGYNEYLVMGGEAAIDRLRNAGIECELVNSHFDPADWVIVASENRNIDLNSESLGLSSNERISFGDQVLVKRDVGKSLQEPANGVMLLDLPDHGMSVEYQFEQPGRIALQDLVLIDSLVNLVSRDSVEAYDRRLEAFVSRYSDSDSIMAARDWIADKFQSYGLDVTLDPFHPTWSNPVHDPLYNVVGDITGTTAPETYIVVGAHYDATSSGNARLVAPGADDNGSGTSMCIEFARILSDFDVPKSFRIICFAGEEQGLVGSSAYVENHPGLNIEFMINADMIANNSGGNTFVRFLHSPPSRPYALLFEQSVDQYSTLVADINVGNTGRSDHASFERAGYHAGFVQEQVFSPNYHSPNDIADNLDFDYMAQVVRGSVAMAYQIAFAPPAVQSMMVTDMGTGNQLGVSWEGADDSRDFQYEVKVGTTPGIYTSLHYVPKTDTFYVVGDLTEGTEYYIALGTVIEDTLQGIFGPTGSGTPHSVPYAPTNVTATAYFKAIELTWEKSIHPDVVSYAVFRSVSGDDDFDTVAVVDSDEWTDTAILQENYYDYYIEAIDADLNYSAPSDTATSRGLYFNRNALVIVELSPWDVDSSMSLPRYRYDFADIRHDMIITFGGQHSTDLSIEQLGQYKSVFWLSERTTSFAAFIEDFNGFASWGGNIFVGGYGPTISLAQDSPEWFGLEGYGEQAINDFIYARGEPGWPDAIVDSSVASFYNNYGATQQLRLVPWLAYDDNVSSPIYRYVSDTPGGVSDNQVCGLYNVTDSVTKIFVSFPFFQMKLESGRSIVDRAAELMGIPRDIAGDINDDTRQNLVDIILMIRILYAGGNMPEDMNRLDVNNDCTFDILDLQYMISYLYLGGAPPTYGCVSQLWFDGD